MARTKGSKNLRPEDRPVHDPNNKGGRTPLYNLEDFTASIDSFIEDCEINKIEPTDWYLIKTLKISPTTLDRYRASDNDDSKVDKAERDKYKGFGAVLKKLDMFREDYAIRQTVDNPKLAGHTAFKLKQAHWGNWTDKPQQDSNNLNLNIKINGESAKSFE